MNTVCTCGAKFRDAEDWRDHMPCPGNEVEALKLEIAWLRLSAQSMSSALNLIDFYLGNTEGGGFNYEMECDPKLIADQVKKKLEKPKTLSDSFDLTTQEGRSAFRKQVVSTYSNYCSICGIDDCPGAPRFKGICPDSEAYNKLKGPK